MPGRPVMLPAEAGPRGASGSAPVVFRFSAAALQRCDFRITGCAGFERAAQFCKFLSKFRVAEPPLQFI